MSIQQSINQGVSVASLLYTQTPQFEKHMYQKQKTKITQGAEQLASEQLENKLARNQGKPFETMVKANRDIAKLAKEKGQYKEAYKAEENAQNIEGILNVIKQSANEQAIGKTNNSLQQMNEVKQRFSLARKLKEENPVLSVKGDDVVEYNKLKPQQQAAVRNQLKGTQFYKDMKEKSQK